ncbi:MAG: DUF2066 domain-containing protein [Rhodomicrobiaceae bacterium]
MCRLLLLVLTLVFTGWAAHAEEVKDLYRAQAIVTGTQEPERTRGFRVGLVDAVIKLTGDVRLGDSDKLKPLLEHPHPLIEHFEYEDRMKGIPVHDEQGTRERPFFLRMQFNAPEMDKALAGLGLHKWGPDRPLLAVWLGVKTAVGDFVLTKTGGDGYAQRIVITETSERRGIPVLLPDEDGGKLGVGFGDIAASNFEKIKGASAKADGWLCGVLSLTESGYWDISWRLFWQGKSHVWSKRNVTFDVALKDGLQTSALIFSGNTPM